MPLIDHSVHGLVAIRLEDAPPEVAAALVHQLGPSQGTPSGPPDLTIAFTARLPVTGELRLLDANVAAFDDRDFYLLDEAGRRIRIDVGALGEPCRLVCEAGVRGIPMLAQMVGLALLRKGYVLLHSSAFLYNGKGILVTGWKKGGKTELLLPFMAAGADYLADEWTIVGGPDLALYGLAGVVSVRNWHLRDLPRFWTRLTRSDRRRLQFYRLYLRIYRAVPGRDRRQSLPFRVLRQLSREDGPAGLGLARVQPQDLFAGRVWRGAAPLDRVFLGLAVRGPIHVAPVEAEEVARRMVYSLAYERAELMAAYQQFRFAFPARSNPWIETAPERERQLLSHALAGIPAYQIRHPYPVPLPDLYRAAAPFCS